MVFHGVKPEEIYLSTFTEKAAFQLIEGLRALLGQVTDTSGVPFDLSQMYIGTVHSLCQRLLTDRRFYPNRRRGRAPQLLDDLQQYFYIYKQRIWKELTEIGAFSGEANREINELFEIPSRSRHKAVTQCISLFNRLSEERIDPEVAATRITDPVFLALLMEQDEAWTTGKRYFDMTAYGQWRRAQADSAEQAELQQHTA